MNIVTRNSTEAEIEAYWKEVMRYRMPESCEVTRLITALKGFYFEDDDDTTSLFDFVRYAKRPWGNKNIEQSIMFNLGWDVQRVLCYMQEPQWVTMIAEDLYKKVVAEIEKENTSWI